MLPEVWGKYFWFTLHSIALGYPTKPSDIDKKNYSEFFKSLQNIIPCYACAVNYEQHIKELPITSSVLLNNETLFLWTVAIHNIVNRNLKKPFMSNKDALRLFTKSIVSSNQDMVDAFGNLTEMNKYNKVNCGWKLFQKICICGNIILIVSILIFILHKLYVKFGTKKNRIKR